MINKVGGRGVLGLIPVTVVGFKSFFSPLRCREHRASGCNICVWREKMTLVEFSKRQNPQESQFQDSPFQLSTALLRWFS